MTTLNDVTQNIAPNEQCACFSVRKAARSITQLYDDVLRSAGLRTTQFTLLRIAKCTKDIRLTEMADTAVMDRTTLSRNLKPLVNRGLLIIEKSDDDKRVKVIKLTKKGLSILKEAEPLWEQAQQQLAKKIGVGSFDMLLSELSDLVSNVRR